LPAVSSTPDRYPEQRDAKPVFFLILLVILTCVQGIRVSDVPVPFALFFGIFYLFLFRPPIPAAAPRVYAIVISYLLLVSTVNALRETGGVRDFLYIGICLTNIAVTITLFDLFRDLGARKVGIALMVVALFEVTLQILEFFDVGGFNGFMAPVLRFWAAQTNSEAFLSPEQFATRAPGTFGASTGAGMALYLVVRGAAIVLRRRSMIYLSIIPIIIGGARNALVIFLLWEIFIQVPLYWRRNSALAVTGLLLIFTATITLLAFPRLITGVFIFNSLTSPTRFAEGVSVVNRLRSFQWALQHWQQVATFGGLTSAELADRISWQGGGVDSELVLRSLQFGFTGFLCLLASNIWTGFFWRNPDSWFIVVFAIISSLTNAMLTNFVLFPFIIIYCLCLYLDQIESPRRMPPQN
jgi:hypothetical protein